MTDGQTDRQTDRITTPKTALAYARAVKIKNGGLDQYGVGPLEQQQFGTAAVGGVMITLRSKFVICRVSKQSSTFHSIHNRSFRSLGDEFSRVLLTQ